MESRRPRPVVSVSDQQRYGAAAVEMAIIAPVFLLLIAGIVEFGQAFQIKHSLANAARRGARLAIVPGMPSDRVRERVQGHAAQLLRVAPERTTVVIALNGDPDAEIAGAVDGSEITVTVSVLFSDCGVGFFSQFLGSTMLSASCVLERE